MDVWEIGLLVTNLAYSRRFGERVCGLVGRGGTVGARYFRLDKEEISRLRKLELAMAKVSNLPLP
jgi:hypothetical protein